MQRAPDLAGLNRNAILTTGPRAHSRSAPRYHRGSNREWAREGMTYAECNKGPTTGQVFGLLVGNQSSPYQVCKNKLILTGQRKLFRGGVVPLNYVFTRAQVLTAFLKFRTSARTDRLFWYSTQMPCRWHGLKPGGQRMKVMDA